MVVTFQILTALNFFGHGSDQKGVGADSTACMSQPWVSLTLTEVINAVNVPAVLRANIRFPNTLAERRFVIQR